MSTGKGKVREETGLPAQDRDAEMDKLVEESKLMLANTRAFIERLAKDEAESAQYLTGMKNDLERQLDRLQRKRDEAAGDPENETQE